MSSMKNNPGQWMSLLGAILSGTGAPRAAQGAYLLGGGLDLSKVSGNQDAYIKATDRIEQAKKAGKTPSAEDVKATMQPPKTNLDVLTGTTTQSLAAGRQAEEQDKRRKSQLASGVGPFPTVQPPRDLSKVQGILGQNRGPYSTPSLTTIAKILMSQSQGRES